MLEWITPNWIWLVLALGAGWVLLRGVRARGGGREHPGRPESGSSRVDPDSQGGHDHHDGRTGSRAGSMAGSRRHGGCC